MFFIYFAFIKYVIILSSLACLKPIRASGPFIYDPPIYPRYGVSKQTAQFTFTGPIFPPSLTQLLAFSTPFVTIPKTTISIIKMSWSTRLVVDVSIAAATNTGCTLSLNKYLDIAGTSSIIALKVMVGVFDTSYYGLISQNFQYIESRTSFIGQNISITGHEQFNVQFLVAYEDDFDPVVRRAFASISTPDLSQTLSATHVGQYATNILNMAPEGYLIKRIKYDFHTLTQHTHRKFDKYVAQFSSIMSAVVGSTFNAHNAHLQYPDSFIYGLHSLKNVYNHLSLSLSFDLYPFTSTNNQPLIAYFGLYQGFCPNDSRQFNLVDQSCYEPCPDGTFIIPQIPSSNSFFKCSLCQSPCYKCTNNPLNCTTCISNYRLNAFDALYMRSCKCPLGQYYDSTGACARCNDQITYCVDCDNNTFCIRCQDSLYFNTTTNTCACPNGQGLLPNTISYKIDAVTYYLNKVRCISQILSQSCDLSRGFSDFYLSCSCLMGGPVIDNTCS